MPDTDIAPGTAGEGPEAAEEAPEILELEYDDGTTERCEVLGAFDCAGREYLALAPEADDGCVYLYRYEEHDDGTFSLADVGDDELAAASAVFEELADDEG